MANPVTIELKILTAKAGTNVKALAKQTGELKVKMDSATESIRGNKGEQSRFVPQTKKTTDAVDEQGNAYDRLKKRATTSLGKAGLVSLYAGAGLAAGTMVRRTIQVGRDFEQQLADLEAITGITGKQLQDLGKDALDLSVEYGEAASKIIEANKLVASQLAEKIDFGTSEGAAELAKVSEEAVVLQKASGVDLPTAVKTLTTAINQFNLPASESARIINSIAAGSKFGAAEVGNQAEAYKQAGSVAAGANLSFEQLNATVQVLAANAIVGGQAGTNIRGILLSLQNAAKLAEAGVQDVSLETHGYTGTLEALKPVLEDTVALEKLFGRENIASARILIQNAESVAEMTEKVTGGNVAYEQAAIQLDTYNGAASRLSAAIDAQLIPAFLEQGGATVQLMNWTTDLIQEFSGGISVINNWLDAFSDARDEMKLTSGITSNQIRTIADLRKELAAAAEQGELNASQEKELRDAYEATNEQLFNSITPLQQKINQQIAERSGLEERLELLKENLGWEEKSNEELLNSQSAAGELVKQIQALNMQIGNNQEQVSKLIQEYQAGKVSFEEFLESMNASNEVTEAQSESVETLGTQFKNNKERIDELVSSINELSLAEFNELQSLTAQNEAIQEQINKRKELAGLGQDLRPEVENPEPISIPIELDTTELDRMVDEGLINLDVPLQSIDDILQS